MSDLKSVLAFFIGLVIFVFLIAFAIGKIRLPSKPKTTVAVVTSTPTPAPTKTETKKTDFWTSIKSLFAKKPADKSKFVTFPTVIPTAVPSITPTTVPNATPVPTKKPGFWSAVTGIFTKKPNVSVTPTSAPVPTQTVVLTATKGGINVNPTLKAALRPDTGAKKVYVQNTVNGVVTIPETGTETLFLPLSLLLGSVGVWFKKRK